MSTFATPPTRLTLAPTALGLADLPARGRWKLGCGFSFTSPNAGRSIRRSAAKPERVGGGKTAELLCRRSTHDPLSTTGEAP